MKNFFGPGFRRSAGFFLGLGIFLLVITCSLAKTTWTTFPPSPPGNYFPCHSAKKLKIVATILPLQEFAQAVCQEKGEIDLLIPPGVDIHSWSPRPSHLQDLAQADCFLFVGKDLEPWISEIRNSVTAPSLRWVEVAQVLNVQKDRISLPGAYHSHHHDPHLWLDFEIDVKIIDLLVDVFSEVLPEEAAYFRQNGQRYQDELEKLDKLYAASLANCRQRIFVVGGHAAFGYLAHRYGLQQIALSGVTPNAHPSTRTFVEIIKLMKNNNIKTVFVDPFSPIRLAKALAAETGATIVTLNPGVLFPPEKKDQPGIFLSIMRENLEKLKNALGCQ